MRGLPSQEPPHLGQQFGHSFGNSGFADAEGLSDGFHGMFLTEVQPDQFLFALAQAVGDIPKARAHQPFDNDVVKTGCGDRHVRQQHRFKITFTSVSPVAPSLRILSATVILKKGGDFLRDQDLLPIVQNGLVHDDPFREVGKNTLWLRRNSAIRSVDFKVFRLTQRFASVASEKSEATQRVTPPAGDY